ncbi:B3 domain-containing transcription factor VRN1-like [Senna tora]|uniref:B3 domain-containing transcription factor VRN1-like n=1 Tax=Senna tora TaxID=362788 RepID=A0A834T1S6_9FABA|nr:B3 domain-containing transcription factor VRN1-like [Senna tora]
MAQIITQLPSFFKVLVAKDFSTQLQIPQVFVNTFSDIFMSNQFHIHTHSADHFWKVEVESFNERTYFTKGWEEFVKENLLEFLDFIVFKYVDPSRSSYENQIRNKGQEKERKEVTYIDIDPPTDEKENDDSKEHVKRSIALAHEEARRFKSNHPFFQVDLHPSYVNSFMYLPTKFYKTYLKGKVEEVKLEVSGRIWSVGLIRVNGNQKSKCNSARLSRGWRAFFEENKLKPGEVCIFEMKKWSNFQVHIFRC